MPAWLTWKAVKALPWRWIFLALAAVAAAAWLWAEIVDYGDAREAKGRNAAMALWAADSLKRDAVNAGIIAAAQRQKDEAQARNTEVISAYNEQIVAIASDRNSLSRRLRDYENSLRRVAAVESPGAGGTADASPVASSTAEVDRLTDELDAACRADAAQLNALIAVVKPQM